MRQFATDMFKNGNDTQVLKKRSNKNMDFGWEEDSCDLPTIEEMPYALYPRFDYLRNQSTRTNEMVHIAKYSIEDYWLGLDIETDYEHNTITVTLTNNGEEAVEFSDFLDIAIAGNITEVSYTGSDLTADLLPYKGYIEVMGVGSSIAAGASITTTITLTGTLRDVDEDNYYTVIKMLLVPKPTRQQAGYVLTANNRGGFEWTALPE